MSKYQLVLVKDVQRSVADDTLSKQIKYICERSVSSIRAKQGWRVVGKPEIVLQDGEIKRYVASINFKRDGKALAESLEQEQFVKLTEIAQSAANSHHWVIAVNGDTATLPLQVRANSTDLSNKEVAKFCLDDHEKFFQHLFERDNQIKIVQSALRAALLSDMEDRPHVCLQGLPGCGKTAILAGVREQLGEDAVMNFDATSLTKAGAERQLLEAEKVPPILCIEEIEKGDETALRWLLGLMDSRGEIRKTNFRVGTVCKTTKMLVLATVNNVSLFRRMMEGALASRFVHEVHCPRPERAILQKILEREVERMNGGKHEWIQPTLDYCIKEEGAFDPRRVIAVMISGRDDLLDGSFQKALKATRPPKE